MAKTNKKAKTTTSTITNRMVTAPWIYINDNTPTGYITKELAALIPNAYVTTVIQGQQRFEYQDTLSAHTSHVTIVRDTRNDKDFEGKKELIRVMQAKAMRAGANFVSVNVTNDFDEALMGQSLSSKSNHISLAATSGAAKTIYKWLFTVLTVHETLHLISDADMRRIDKTLFPEYEYCSISEARSKPKNAKIQFVAVILSKPQVIAGNKLTWTVADKTGSASFYFQHRGEPSQYTWDWVLSLKPGDRKALPRMPMVQVKERIPVRILKAPLRAAGAVIGATGFVLKQTGQGLSKVCKTIKMGKSNEWVPEADVDAAGKKIDRTRETKQDTTINCKGTKKLAEITDEKGEKIWDDDASEASTEAGTEIPDYKEKEFL